MPDCASEVPREVREFFAQIPVSDEQFRHAWREQASRCGLPSEWADEQIDSGRTPEEMMKACEDACIRQIMGPILLRTANDDVLVRAAGAVTPSSYNAESRTFEATISTGAPVDRRDARGKFVELLDLSGVDPATLAGLPVLDGHRQNGSENVVGSILNARREAHGIVATIQLSAADDVRNALTKIAEGSLRGVSIGYSAISRSEGVDPTSGRRTVTIKPKIHEVSVVPIPADPKATIRSEAMPDVITPDEATIQHRAAVRELARKHDLTPEWADEQIDAGHDMTAVRSAAFEAITRRESPRIHTQVGVDNDDPSVIVGRRTEALVARVSGTAPKDEARPYMSDRLIDHARALVTMRGISTVGMDQDAIFRAAMHTTSDFPLLLTSVGNRVLMPAYEAAQSPLKQLARQALHADFRPAYKLKLGEIGQLEKVNESGEITSTSRSEASESYALDSYGSLFSLSRKALINDDLGAFRDWGNAAGRAAAQTEASLLLSLLTQSSGAGPVMGEDGKRMFDAAHNNVGTPGAISETTLTEARLAMRTQKGLDGKTPIQVVPKYLLIGPELETTAEKVLSSIQAVTTADVNVFAGKLSMLVEPRIADASWYIFADPANLAALEYAYLSSAQGPQIQSQQGWDVLGMEFRVFLDFGSGPVDYRAAFRNAGA